MIVFSVVDDYGMIVVVMIVVFSGDDNYDAGDVGW